MATKKAAATKKKAATKKTAEPGAGRKSQHAGKRITRLKKTEETGLRETGNVRVCWDLIKDGMTVEKYREVAVNAGQHSGHALAILRGFAKDGYVKLSKAE
jgi:hypothetical protein